MSERFEDKTHQESAIDPEILNSIFEDDHDTQQDLLQKFVSQSNEILSEFETAFRQHDVDQVRFHSHKLKSSARTVGANSLADLCFALEKAAQNSNWTEINGLANDLRPTIEHVEDYVKQF